MNRIVYELKAFTYDEYDPRFIPEELRPKQAPSYIFSSKKKAEDFHNNKCFGCGLIQKVRCINNMKFEEGLEVNPDDLHEWYKKGN